MMKLIFLVLMLQSASAQSWKKFHLANGCRVFDQQGKSLKKFPGEMCLFFDDGRLVSASKKELALYNKDFQKLWSISGHFHHQLNFSRDGSKILALASEVVEREKKKVRLDKVLMISLEGKILQQVLSDELMKQVIKKPILKDSSPQLLIEVGANFELTHFNSIYEMGKNTGNFIVNGRGDGIFILSPDFKLVKKHLVLPTSNDHAVHDVQELENGNLLLFNNLTADSHHLNRSSAIQEYDLVKKKVVYEFTGHPKALFYVPVAGSVQRLDEDHFLYSHLYNGTFIYSKSKKDFEAVIVGTHEENGLPYFTQQVKALDLTKFMSHWK